MKATVMPIMVEGLGTFPKTLEKWGEVLDIEVKEHLDHSTAEMN